MFMKRDRKMVMGSGWVGYYAETKEWKILTTNQFFPIKKDQIPFSLNNSFKSIPSAIYEKYRPSSFYFTTTSIPFN